MLRIALFGEKIDQKNFQKISMGGRAEGLAYADPRIQSKIVLPIPNNIPLVMQGRHVLKNRVITESKNGEHTFFSETPFKYEEEENQ